MTDPFDQEHNEADSVIAAARVGVVPDLLALGELYSVPQADGSVRVIDLATNDYRKRQGLPPIRKTGHVNLTEHASFVGYVNDHKTPEGTELFGDRDAGRIVAVLNAHGSGDAGPGWGDHRATLTLRQTPAWKAWTAASGKLLPQADFAELLEDRAGDVVEPDHARLLEIATSIEGKKDVAYKSGVRLDSGEVRFRYEETIEARAGRTGELDIPSTIKLALAPFEGMAPFEVTARFRYRLNDGQLRLGVVLDRPEDVLRAAFADVAKQIESGTDLTVMFGTPAA